MTGSIKRNAMWMTTGNGIYALCQWLFVILIARFNGAEGVGYYTLALAITTPIIVFTNMGLRTSMVTDTKNLHSFDDYFSLRTISTLFSLVILGGVLFFSDYNKFTMMVIALIGMAKAVEAISEINYALAQKQEKMKLIAYSLILRGTVGVIIFSLVLYFTENLIYAVSSLGFVWLIVLLFHDMKTNPENGEFHFEYKNLFALAKLSLPVGITAMLWPLSLNMPRYTLESSFGAESLGVFAAMAYFITAGSVVSLAIGQAICPQMAKQFSQKNVGRFFALVGKSHLIALALGVVGILFAAFIGEWLLSFIYGAKFAQHNDVFVVLMIAALFNHLNNMMSYALQSTRFFKSRLAVALLVVGISFVITPLVVPVYGIKGAAYILLGVLLANYLISVILFTWICNKHLK